MVLQALANNISKLTEIASFADINPSTAHYHLKNLIREGRIVKKGIGNYFFNIQSFENREQSVHTFQNLSKFHEHSTVFLEDEDAKFQLNTYEKSLLLEILNKENRYSPYSTKELAEKCNCSVNTILKYTLKLEEKKLISRKKVNNQFIYSPTNLTIHSITDFLKPFQNREQLGRSSSKPCTTSIPPLDNNIDNRLTFEEFLAWQQKNAHRFIIQFKLLRCNHNRLKKTGWIFGPKSIHKHFTEAYIFKSKDPRAEVLNVLPKHPFIFKSDIEFQRKLIDFVNELIERLKEYGITIDLSEPAEIKLQHVALEDDEFARKVIRKGLLYFRSKVKTVSSTGDTIEYAIAIDKSKALHLEFEGSEAQHFSQEYNELIDDVVTGRIDRRALRDIPQKLGNIEETVTTGIQEIQKTQTGIENFQSTLHQNQLRFSHDLVSHVEMIKQVTEYTQSINQAAQIMREAAESLKEAINSSPFRRFLNFIWGGSSE